MQKDKFDIIIPPQDIACEPGLQEKLADGNPEAFAWVYRNYCKRVYNYAMLMTNDAEKSEDIVQEVFYKLWMNRKKLRGIENFSGYLNRICRNYVITVFRNEKREAEGKKGYATTTIQSYNAVEEIIDYKETSKLVLEAIQKLPRCRREIFEMKQAGIENEKIAEVLGIRQRTIWNQLHNASNFLKEKLVS